MPPYLRGSATICLPSPQCIPRCVGSTLDKVAYEEPLRWITTPHIPAAFSRCRPIPLESTRGEENVERRCDSLGKTSCAFLLVFDCHLDR